MRAQGQDRAGLMISSSLATSVNISALLTVIRGGGLDGEGNKDREADSGAAEESGGGEKKSRTGNKFHMCLCSVRNTIQERKIGLYTQTGNTFQQETEWLLQCSRNELLMDAACLL